jgi:hypothetical protein
MLPIVNVALQAGLGAFIRAAGFAGAQAAAVNLAGQCAIHAVAGIAGFAQPIGWAVSGLWLGYKAYKWFTKKPAGYLTYLAGQYRGNLHDNGIVTITAKSIADDPASALRNVVDLDFDSWFQSKDEPDQWICWDFHGLRFCPIGYVIKTQHLRSWILEGSLDGEHWRELDRRTGVWQFKGQVSEATFPIANPMECRFIRLTQTDVNHYGNDALLLDAIEFLGQA